MCIGDKEIQKFKIKCTDSGTTYLIIHIENSYHPKNKNKINSPLRLKQKSRKSPKGEREENSNRG